LPGVVRTYASFTQVADEAFDARIYGGIHFRSACRDGRALGTQVGSFVTANVAQSARGSRKGQISHDHPRGEIGGDGESPGNDQLTETVAGDVSEGALEVSNAPSSPMVGSVRQGETAMIYTCTRRRSIKRLPALMF